MTDILLINPGGNKKVYGSLYDLTAKEPPIWCLLIAGFLRNHDIDVKILDANVLELDHKQVARYVWDEKPKLTAIVCYGHNPSASTQVMPEATRICKLIKQQNMERIVAMVGGHVAALPAQTLQETGCDYVAGGEGLYDLGQIWEWSKEKYMRYTIVSGGLCEKLDSDIPTMLWDSIPVGQYRSHNWQSFGEKTNTPYGSLYTTLGCPHSCSYCCIQSPFRAGEKLLGYTKNSYRKFLPDWIVRQIDTLYDKGVRIVKFADELFLWNEDHVNAICDRLIERNYDLNIWAYARVDRCSDEILQKMRKAGIKWLCLGIEAGDKDVRRDVKKGFGQDKIFDAVRRIRMADISIIANYMFGLPEDNYETMQATLDLAVKLNTEYANFYACQAYPGSQLYDNLKKQGKVSDDWSRFSQLNPYSTPLDTNHISGKDVLNFRDEAFVKYFDRRDYRSMLRGRYGESAVQQVDNMLEHKIERG